MLSFHLAPAAAAPAAAAPAAAGGFQYGEYDEKLWAQVSKKAVYNKWDPNSPRSTRNFNPFETFKGNSCDASGIYPGEVRSHVIFSLVLLCKFVVYFFFLVLPRTAPLQGSHPW